MKAVSCQRPRDSAIRTDDPKIKPKLLCNGSSKSVAAARDQHDLNPLLMDAAQRSQVSLGNLELRVEQSAVNINGEEANGKRHCS